KHRCDGSGAYFECIDHIGFRCQLARIPFEASAGREYRVGWSAVGSGDFERVDQDSSAVIGSQTRKNRLPTNCKKPHFPSRARMRSCTELRPPPTPAMEINSSSGSREM